MKKKIVGCFLCISLLAESASGIFGIRASAGEMPPGDEVSCMEQTNDLMKEEVEKISLKEAEKLDEEFALCEKLHSTSYDVQEEKVNTELTTAYGYEQLDNTQRQCYKVLASMAESFHINFSETVSKVNSSNQTVYLWGNVDLSSYKWTNIVDFRKVLFALGADHPEYFWITANFSYATNTSGLITKAYLNVQEDYAGVSSRKVAQKSIEEGMKEYVEAIDQAKEEHASELELELLIHDMIIENIDYKYSSGTTPSDEGSAHSITGVFDKTGVVCEGYAKSFQLLANYAGLESIYAVGYGNGGGHAWNLVKLDGEWYNLDVTWDDMNANARPERPMIYTWFNCSTGKFPRHSYQPSVFPGMYGVPQTSADTYNYYTYYDLYVTADDVKTSETISKLLKSALEKAKEKKDFHLQFSCESSSVMNSFMSGLSSSLVTKLSDKENYYYTDGGTSYSTSNGYFVYKNIYSAFLKENVAYCGKTAGIVPVYFYDGRQKKVEEGNYSLTYSDNEQPGQASVLFQGVGDYSKVGSYTLWYTVEAGEPILTNTPTPTNTVTPSPTITLPPTNTVTPSPTVTLPPSNTVAPTNTEKPTNTVAPTNTEKPTNTVAPTHTVKPTNIEKPTNTVAPTNTLAPMNTVTPTNIVFPSITQVVVNTPTVTRKPTPTKTICYQVTYKGNGGKIKNKTTYSVSREKNQTLSLSQLPKATREGYVFLGWYDKKAGGSKVSKSFKVKRNVTLYAHWLKKPSKTKVTLKQNEKGQVKVSWKKVKNVSYYKVYVSESKNGTYKLLKKTKQTSYTDKKRQQGKRYYYYVKSYSILGENTSSSQSDKKSIRIGKND